MDGEANLPGQPVSSKPNLSRPINSSSHALKSHEADFLRNVQAAFKRHRSIGVMQSSKFLPRRCVPPQKEVSRDSSLCSGLTVETKRDVDVEGKVNEKASVIVESQEDASFTPPSMCGTLTNTFDEKYNPFGRNEKEDHAEASGKDVDLHVSNHVESKHVVEGSKKVQFSLASSVIRRGAHDPMATRMDHLSSLLDSIALTEMDWEANSQAQSSNVINNEPDAGPVPDGDSIPLAVKMSALQSELHHLRNFLHNDGSHPMTQSSIVGSSCATTTSVHATSAPILNSTTHSSRPHQDVTAVGSLSVVNTATQVGAAGDAMQQGCCSSVPVNGAVDSRAVSGAQASCSARDAPLDKESQHSSLNIQNQPSKTPSQRHSQSVKEEGLRTDASSVSTACASSKDTLLDRKPELPKSEKHEKAPSRKKGYDPDLFFKVNGKLYQRLGKIGSGGSSEVHKVISSDCTIYALKKIKLKGRDYATAVGFCQEILYLKKLKGKNNIIQLIDYEVTDKALLQEVLNDSINNKDSRVKDDGYIYMVLEYGEIDLAHMLSQKWKEIEGKNDSIDENWLRFYWQQILQAVNTIHEERIVHSDLKPANFLLVKGFLKLIDFGIAKAIMSDTTNIQRDAQVGTLSYMSPEAFLCNESDANGNIIKCGRSSDIWSLGCILYQMVYGHTPFSEYKTFWAKFKVITDPNHEIAFAPVSNPWLLDLMKKCLSWDRNKRWRIPQLLEHPFLVPPIPHQVPPPHLQNCNALQLVAESCANNQEASTLCSRLNQLLGDATAVSRDQQVRLLSQVSSICEQLQQHIANG